jgi:hypothetical protein
VVWQDVPEAPVRVPEPRVLDPEQWVHAAPGVREDMQDADLGAREAREAGVDLKDGVHAVTRDRAEVRKTRPRGGSSSGS